MPSLRQKVTTYFRQLSFIADSPRSPALDSRKSDNDNFIIKYLEGTNERIYLTPSPEINSAQEPEKLQDLKIAPYPTGQNTITAASTGPDEGLTGIKRSKLHLSAGSDIDFIDEQQEIEIRKSISNHNKFSKLNHSNSIQKFRSDQNANKTASTTTTATTPIAMNRVRKNSRTSLQQQHAEKIPTTLVTNEELNKTTDSSTTIIVSMISKTQTESPKIFNNKTDLIESTVQQSSAAKITDADIIKSLILSKNEKENTVPNVQQEQNLNSSNSSSDTVCGIENWKVDGDHCYGISVSLYEYNQLTRESMGNPIADCYGIIARGNVCVMAMADGVNWGDGARLAARSAVHGSLEYLNTAVFGLSQDSSTLTTRDVFVSLLRSLWEGHDCILEVGGALTTLTVAIVLPLNDPQYQGKYVVCACNVGDSLGYVYSKKYGVREFTQGSHDLSSMRDMRDALGALGPVDGNKPELSNLTLSMTICEAGDIIFLTSDGISDNFDPVVGKFTEAFSEAWAPSAKVRSAIEPQLAPKRQNKSASAINSRLNNRSDVKDVASSSKSNKNNINMVSNITNSNVAINANITNSNVPVRPPRSKKSQSPSSGQSLEKATSLSNVPSRPKYMRSHTVIEPRISMITKQSPRSRVVKFPCSPNGLPLVTGPQRHTLTLLRYEDLLSFGINGHLSPCPSARRLCHLLIDFVRMITSARRKTLEQRELFYKLQNGPDGQKREIEMTRVQHRSARKRVVDSKSFISLPGKLDHASVVAYTIGSGLQTKEFQETNF